MANAKRPVSNFSHKMLNSSIFRNLSINFTSYTKKKLRTEYKTKTKFEKTQFAILIDNQHLNMTKKNPKFSSLVYA